MTTEERVAAFIAAFDKLQEHAHKGVVVLDYMTLRAHLIEAYRMSLEG